MKIAVMQPYLFPYIGYFQLINSADKFIFYDDVNYIKQGWVNRNRILVNNTDFMITVPLEKANSFCLIKDTKINHALYNKWKIKTLQTILHSYKRAPFFDVSYNLIKEVFDKDYVFISQLSIESTIRTSEYLGIETNFFISSGRYQNVELNREERLINICRSENGDHYINATGGQEIYNKEYFRERGIQLNFIKPLSITYNQFGANFIPWLSIIDVMMFNSREEIKKMLNHFELI